MVCRLLCFMETFMARACCAHAGGTRRCWYSFALPQATATIQMQSGWPRVRITPGGTWLGLRKFVPSHFRLILEVRNEIGQPLPFRALPLIHDGVCLCILVCRLLCCFAFCIQLQEQNITAIRGLLGAWGFLSHCLVT